MLSNDLMMLGFTGLMLLAAFMGILFGWFTAGRFHRWRGRKVLNEGSADDLKERIEMRRALLGLIYERAHPDRIPANSLIPHLHDSTLRQSLRAILDEVWQDEIQSED